MRWSAIWAAVVLLGLGMMLCSYYGFQGPQITANAALVNQLKESAGSGGDTPSTSDRPDKSKLFSEATRVPLAPFELYLCGQALLLLGCSALAIRLYGFLSTRVQARFLAEPLKEIERRKRLLIGLHVVLFGGMILVSQIAYFLPDVQRQFLTLIGRSVRSGVGPLGVAGSAYLSKSIPRAAAVTLFINFTLGSLITITLPSLIAPGIGVLFTAFRFVLWGLLLCPSIASLSGTMLPHTFTLFAEGEGYILAAFLASLVPIYLFDRSAGTSSGERYGKAFLLNAGGSFWVLIVIAIAAIYEAIEVIAQI